MFRLLLVLIFPLLISACSSTSRAIRAADGEYFLIADDKVRVGFTCFAGYGLTPGVRSYMDDLKSLQWKGNVDANGRATGFGGVFAIYEDGLLEVFEGEMENGYPKKGSYGEYFSGNENDGFSEYFLAYKKGGSIDKKNMSYYRGMFYGCGKDGIGEQVSWSNGNQYKYRGSFYLNTFNGQGVQTNPDNIYVGEFVKNYRQGFGELKDLSGKTIKKGNWFQDGFIATQDVWQAEQAYEARNEAYRKKQAQRQAEIDSANAASNADWRAAVDASKTCGWACMNQKSLDAELKRMQAAHNAGTMRTLQSSCESKYGTNSSACR